MNVKVAKFGGSSLADANQFRKVKSIVLADENRRYVVPSAPGKRYSEDNKITDMLILCHSHVQHAVPFEEVFNIISERYLTIVKELGLSLDLSDELTVIKHNIENGATVDYVASRGEYLNGKILAEFIGYDFVDAEEIIFFKKNGTFDADKTQEVLSQRLKNHERAVIPGFYGVLPDGRIKTFSRGGSDITGAIVARGVQAAVYENWTDVSGFLMADPRIVENPKPIKVITYRELRELSYMGANVLHEETIFPVRKAGIPINIRNTNDPAHPGTMIVNEADYTPGIITGIAGKKDFTVLFIEKTLMKSDISFVRKLLTILESNGIYFEHIPSGIDTMSVVITDSQLENKLDSVIEEIQQQCNPDSIEVYPDMALIATVGQGMAFTPGMAARLFTALAQANINVRMIDQGSSEINIIAGVTNSDFSKAIHAIYNAFVQ
ncbi:MAG: aspartate kinase [Bacillota bacterium]